MADHSPTREERFWSKVDRRGPDDCWEWQGAQKDGRGYGSFRLKSGAAGTTSAHRAAWTIAFAPPPRGLHVLHRCDNPRCVNPGHLFLGTHAENMADMAEKGRAAPVRGSAHPVSKLTEADIRDILLSDETYKAIAERYGVHLGIIGRIKTGEHWAHMHPEVPRVMRQRKHFTAEEREDIKRRYAGGETQSVIARSLGVDQSVISRVCSGGRRRPKAHRPA